MTVSPSSSSFVMVMVLPLSTLTTEKGGETEWEIGWEQRGKRRRRYQSNEVIWEPMITLLVLMLEKQPLVREPEPERNKEVRESDMEGWRAGRRWVNLLSVLHLCLMIHSIWPEPICPHCNTHTHSPTHTQLSTLHLIGLFSSLHCIKYLTKPIALERSLIRNQAVHSRMLLKSCCSKESKTPGLYKMRSTSTHLHLFSLVELISFQVFH